VLHLKSLHPLDDHYGLGCVGAAAGAVAIHNAANAVTVIHTFLTLTG
jgi:phage portal protein BeeE